MNTFDYRLALDRAVARTGLERSALVDILERAILAAAKMTFGPDRQLETRYSEEKGVVELFQAVTIVDEVSPLLPACNQFSISQARARGLDVESGDELVFQLFYRDEDSEAAKAQDDQYGEILKLRTFRRGFGRIAAQTAKKVILDAIDEAQRGSAARNEDGSEAEDGTRATIAPPIDGRDVALAGCAMAGVLLSASVTCPSDVKIIDSQQVRAFCESLAHQRGLVVLSDELYSDNLFAGHIEIDIDFSWADGSSRSQLLYLIEVVLRTSVVALAAEADAENQSSVGFTSPVWFDNLPGLMAASRVENLWPRIRSLFDDCCNEVLQARERLFSLARVAGVERK